MTPAARAADGVAVVVPAYDAATHLPAVLSGIRRHMGADAVFVIDDGSRDATAAIAAGAGVRVLSHAGNRGKGAALCSGFDAARAAGFTHALTLDADGQHPPECIPQFLGARACAEIVIGWRLADPMQMPRARRLSNRATAAILSALAGQTILDGQCGYRLIDLDVVRGLHATERGFMFESELLVRAARRGARLAHIAIPCVYGGQASHVRASQDTVRFLQLVVRSFFW
jgi:glycosyltransferase involved in cell wall biosynthesis